MNKSLLKELEKFLTTNNLEFKADTLEEIYDITWRTKLNIKCKNCRDDFDISVKQLLRPHPARVGKVCPRCNTEMLFVNKLNELYGENPYEFLTTFRGYYAPIKVNCKKCNSVWETPIARSLLMGNDRGQHPCKQCATNRNFKKDIKDLENKLIEKFGKCNYEFLNPEKFTGIYSKQKISVRCKNCSTEFEVNPQNLVCPRNGKHYCRVCNSKKKS